MKTTKSTILQKSLNVFLKDGYKGASMHKIVTTSNISKGTFYHHFKSKEELFLRVFEEYYLNKIQHFYKEIAQTSFIDFLNDVLKRAKEVSDEFFASLDFKMTPKQNAYKSIHLLFLDALQNFPEYNPKVQDLNTKERAYWYHSIKEAQNSGEILNTIGVKEITNLFLFTANGLCLNLLIDNTANFSIDKYKKSCYSIYHLLAKK